MLFDLSNSIKMSSKSIFNLTETGITMFEQYIATKNVNAPPDDISGTYYNIIRPIYYDTLKTSPVTTCYHVGEYNIYWMCYIYKSKNSKIYMVELYLGKDIEKMYCVNDVIFEQLFWQIKKN